MPIPLVAVHAAIAAKLAPAAPSLLGAKEISRLDAVPRYVWQVVGANAEAPSRVGGNPRALANDLWRIIVSCEGRTLEEAILLRSFLVTSVRQVVGADYELGTTEVISDAEDLHDRHIVALELTLRLPLIETQVDAGLLVYPAKQTVTITPELDPGTPASGDGLLDGAEG